MSDGRHVAVMSSQSGLHASGFAQPQAGKTSSPSCSPTASITASVGEVQHASFLSKDIGSLYLNDDYADVRLLVVGADGGLCEFNAHKVILACRSSYFQALLFGGMRETGQATIELRDETSVYAFKQLLKYIYTGRLSLSNIKINDILDVLSLAHKYGFSELESAVTEYIKAIMTVRNMCTVIASSFLESMPALRQYCLDFADTHANEILKTEGFLKLTHATVEQLISRDSFCAEEVDIFRAVREWVLVNAPPPSSSSPAQVASAEAVRSR